MIYYNNLSAFTEVHLGNTNISEVYYGDVKKWPTGPQPFGGKFKATYSDSRTYSVACDSSTELTTATTKPSGYQYSAMTYAEIGNCVTSIGYTAFMGCTSLPSIDIPNGVTIIGQSAFNGCLSLTGVTIGTGVTSIGVNAFYYCTSLTDLTIPSGVTSIGNSAFSRCSGLTSVTIGSSVTYIGNGVFADCTSLTSVTVEAITPPTLGTSVFNNTNNCPIYVPCESVNAYKAAWSAYANRIQCVPQPFGGKFKLTLDDSTVVSADCSSSNVVASGEIQTYSAIVISVEIGRCCQSIGDYAFEECHNITSVTIPNSVTSIGQAAFNVCSGLTNIDIPNSVTSIGEAAFHLCYNLTSIVIPSGVTSIGESTFGYCTGLTSIEIPDSVTTIGAYAFSQCRSLPSVTIPSGVTSIGYGVFTYCSGLTSVTVNATTPPALGGDAFNSTNNYPIYVPAESVDAYKNAGGYWSDYTNRIQAIP